MKKKREEKIRTRRWENIIMKKRKIMKKEKKSNAKDKKRS